MIDANTRPVRPERIVIRATPLQDGGFEPSPARPADTRRASMRASGIRFEGSAVVDGKDVDAA